MFRVLALFLFALVSVAAIAHDGNLDTTFADAGQYTVAFDSSTRKYDAAMRTVIDPQGRYVMVGYVDYAQVGLVRLRRDGTPDTSFNSGSATRTSSAPAGTLTDAVLDRQGRIVVVGYGMNPLDNDPFVCRFLPGGAPDTAVGATGCRFVPVDYTANGDDRANAVAVGDNGNIYVVGAVQRNDPGDYDFFVMLLREADATPETAFGGGDGIATIPFDLDGNHAGGDHDEATSILLYNGYAYIGGYAYTSVFSSNDFAFAKVTLSGGVPDPAFCANATVCTDSEAYQGKRTLSFTQTPTRFNERVRHLAFGPNGYLLVAGEASDNSGTDLVLTRLNFDGSVPTGSFGNESNRQRSSLYPELSVNGLVSDFSGGRILVSGTTAASAGNPNPLRLMWVGRFFSYGLPDENFFIDGNTTSWVSAVSFPKLSSTTPLDHVGGTLAMDRGRIVLTGGRLWNRDTQNNVDNFDFAIARLQGDVIFQDGLGD